MALRLAGGLLALLLTSSWLSAQTALVPALLNGVEGGFSSNVPFGSTQACRYQVIVDAQELPWTGPRQINGIALRADNGSPGNPGPGYPAKGFLNVSIWMSTTHATAATASGVFEDNWGEDVQNVLFNHPVQLPAQPAVAAGPRPADVTFQFTNPWWYGLTPARPNKPAPTSLLIEILVLSQPSGAYPLDNLGGCISPKTAFGNQGPLCADTSLPPPSMSGDVSMSAGGVYNWFVHDLPADAPYIVAFNLTSQGMLFGNPAYTLPYPMFDPQNPSQPSAALTVLQWSAPDCWINIDPRVTVFGLADSNGLGTMPTPLPPGREYVGLEVFAQAFAVSLTANQLQTISTPGMSATVCGPLGVSRIFAFYNGSGVPVPAPPSTGSVQYGLGPVFEVL